MHFTSRTLLTIALTSMILCSCSFSQEDVLNRFEKKTFESESGFELPYRQLAPMTIEDGKKYPLVIFLHGAGERGDDNQAQLKHGMSAFASDEMLQQYPAYVIAPQCPKEQKWVEVDWSAGTHEMPDKPSNPLAATMELIQQAKSSLPIDEKRIYVTGLSMGGYGTWDLLARHPDWFAGAVVVCGGGDSSEAVANRIKHIPVWVVHGDEDGAVNVKRARDMIAALKAVGGEPIYTEMKGVGHDSWTATYANPETFKWLFDQKK